MGSCVPGCGEWEVAYGAGLVEEETGGMRVRDDWVRYGLRCAGDLYESTLVRDDYGMS